MSESIPQTLMFESTTQTLMSES